MIYLNLAETACRGRTTRQLKVSYAHYDPELNRPHPMIRLRGKYLEPSGFSIGDMIEVRLGPGQITITRVEQSTKGIP